MLKHAFRVASLTVALLAGNALAQVPNLVNGNLETPDPVWASLGVARPNGWRLYQASMAEYRTNPIYLGEPERWLESQVRRNIDEIEANIAPHCLYGQALGSLHGERSALDLLGIDHAGRLNIFELKVTEDIHLPLQAFDYWLRIRHHLGCGDFSGSGYFPGRELSRNAPRIFLLSPSLHFHPMTEAVLRWLPPACEVIRIGLNGDWRERVDVVLRR